MSAVGGAAPLDDAGIRPRKNRPSTGSVRSAITVSVPEFKSANAPENMPMPPVTRLMVPAAGERVRCSFGSSRRSWNRRLRPRYPAEIPAGKTRWKSSANTLRR